MVDIILYKDLSEIPDKIQAELHVPGDETTFELDTYLTSSEISTAEAVTTPFTPFHVISFFKIKDGGVLQTSFEPNLEIHLTFTHDAWYDQSSESHWQENERPPVFYLEKKGTGWASQWEEFPSSVISATAPEDQYDTGKIIISIGELPDPYIGGTGGG